MARCRPIFRSSSRRGRAVRNMSIRSSRAFIRSRPPGFAVLTDKYYNPYFEGWNISMPPLPLANKSVTYSDGTRRRSSREAHDIVTFPHPGRPSPKWKSASATGFGVMVFLVVLAGLLFLSYRQGLERRSLNGSFSRSSLSRSHAVATNRLTGNVRPHRLVTLPTLPPGQPYSNGQNSSRLTLLDVLPSIRAKTPLIEGGAHDQNRSRHCYRRQRRL